MINNPEVSIIIVNYNTKEYTAQCIQSIYSHPPLPDFEIILVDNNSTDDSADWLQEKFLQVKLVRSRQNLGIAGGNNKGIQAKQEIFTFEWWKKF